MKTLRITHLHAVCLLLAGLFALAVAPLHAGETIRWGHSWFTTSNPSMEVKPTGWHEAHVIVPVAPMTVSQIAFRGGTTRAGSPIYHVGIQGDDGTPNHYPNGQWLGGTDNFAATAIPTSGWQTVSLPAAVALETDARYHLVIEAAVADASNYSSIYRNHQNDRRCFRIRDGVYDETVGREAFNGTSWSRAHAFPILAIDTNANQAVGQPWGAGENTFAFNQDWRDGQTFTLDIAAESSTVELLSFSLYVSTIYLAPADDLRVHLLQAGNPDPLVSMVLVDKDSLPPLGMVTVATPPVKLRKGDDYQFIVESTNTTASGFYRVLSVHGPLDTEIAQAADATFQGASSSCVSSYKNGAWTVKKSGGGSATDLVFEMQLRVPDMATLVVVR